MEKTAPVSAEENHVQFFTAIILEWKQLLKPEKYKQVILESLRFPQLKAGSKCTALSSWSTTYTLSGKYKLGLHAKMFNGIFLSSRHKES